MNVDPILITDLSYSPDIAAPGASEAIEALAPAALAAGTRRLVLLSGPGEAEAERPEPIVDVARGLREYGQATATAGAWG